jgi:hypothetical protein
MTRDAATAYLRGIRAQHDARSTGAKTFGWAAGVRQYYQVLPDGPGYVQVTLHATCPCAKS